MSRTLLQAYPFSQDVMFQVAVTWLVVPAYHWCWTPRTLRVQTQAQPPRYASRTPAQAAGLTAAPWPLQQVLADPLYQARPPSKQRKRRRRKAKRPAGG